MVGLGECGLPPKKPNCYLADICDCESFMLELADKIPTLWMQEMLSNKEMMMKIN